MVTDMHMTGFLSLFDDVRQHSPCLVIFLNSWKLDSGAKFALAVVGAILAGIVCEGILKLRTVGQQRLPKDRPALSSIARILLYLLHRTVGYLAMLLAMTYQTEIFFAVLVGLSIGYAIFNLRDPIGEGETACCNTTQGRVMNGGVNGVLPQASSSGSQGMLLSGSKPQLRMVVDGMTCRSCSHTLERALSQMPGVLSASAKHTTGECIVIYADEERIDAESVRTTVEDHGYEVTSTILNPQS